MSSQRIGTEHSCSSGQDRMRLVVKANIGWPSRARLLLRGVAVLTMLVATPGHTTFAQHKGGGGGAGHPTTAAKTVPGKPVSAATTSPRDTATGSAKAANAVRTDSGSGNTGAGKPPNNSGASTNNNTGPGKPANGSQQPQRNAIQKVRESQVQSSASKPQNAGIEGESQDHQYKDAKSVGTGANAQKNGAKSGLNQPNLQNKGGNHAASVEGGHATSDAKTKQNESKPHK